MITLEKLQEQFYPVEQVGENVIRCEDELPRKTILTYFQLCGVDSVSPFVVSDGVKDDDFAISMLRQIGCEGVERLTKIALTPNAYDFTYILLVPHEYHSELKGRLDVDRPYTTLCIPIFRSEFSGLESIEEFIKLRRDIVPTLDWKREITPKIVLRFDNTATGNGTGDGYVFARFTTIMREIDNLTGVDNGFVEILNYRDTVIEIVFSEGSNFTVIKDRNDSASGIVSRKDLTDILWAFLTE